MNAILPIFKRQFALEYPDKILMFSKRLKEYIVQEDQVLSLSFISNVKDMVKLRNP